MQKTLKNISTFGFLNMCPKSTSNGATPIYLLNGSTLPRYFKKSHLYFVPMM